MFEFELASGSVPGRDHVGSNGLLIGKNNQDGLQVVEFGGDSLIAVVTDGCGSRPHSEVGAKLGAQLLCSAVVRRAARLPAQRTPEMRTQFWESVRQDVLAQLRSLALTLSGDSGSLTAVIDDSFLFTVVAMLITGEQCEFVGIGDGVIFVNGEKLSLGPYPENKPPYMAYQLVDTEFSAQPELLRFVTHRVVRRSDLQSALLGSDGVDHFIAAEQRVLPGKTEQLGQIAQFWSNDRYFTNSHNIRRRLVLANSETIVVTPDGKATRCDVGLLPDDTTIVAVRRTKLQ